MLEGSCKVNHTSTLSRLGATLTNNSDIIGNSPFEAAAEQRSALAQAWCHPETSISFQSQQSRITRHQLPGQTKQKINT